MKSATRVSAISWSSSSLFSWSAAPTDFTMLSAQTWNLGSSSVGTPSSRQITFTGRGYETSSTTSIRVRPSRAASSPSTTS